MSTTAPITNWHTYLNRRMAALVVLGFSSGLPLYILLNLMQAWLATSGLSLKALGLFALVQFPYFWKFLWAPFMDRFNFGGFGRRRGWMIVTQIALFFAIGGMGMLDPKLQVGAVVAATSLVAFLSASQDVVIDAYRRETLSDEEQGLGVAVYVNAYKVASMVPGALSLILADRMPWQPVFCALLIKEPTVYGDRPATMVQAIVLPFKEFFQRDGWRRAVWLLTFILMYKIGDSMATALATKFYLDLGFSMTEIGWAANATAFWASIAGGIVGGVWMVKLGINRGLWVFGFLQAIAILGFAWLAQVGHNTTLLAAVIGFEAFASLGLGAAALVAFMARSSDLRYTATQYALFSALSSVPRIFVNSSVGFVIEETGWFWFFIVCFILAFPAMMMLPKIAPWNSGHEKA